jgi:dolichyl-phosphate mannosyltransferase polypeptide 3
VISFCDLELIHCHVLQIYLLLILPQITESSPVPSILPLKVQVEIIPVLPFWALITLASYLLGRLGLGIMTFKDCDEAYAELMGQIDAAKGDLDARKVGWN